MSRGKDGSKLFLETRTVAAQRAYLNALVEWDGVLHKASCPVCRPEGWSEDESARRCETAEIEKERCRLIFRGLCDDLGYVPAGYGVTLPDSDFPCCRREALRTS